MNYGFALPEQIDDLYYNEFKNRYQVILERRKIRWNLIDIKQYSSNSSKLKRFIRKGIPTALREEVWMKFTGAEERMKSNPDLFKSLLEKEIDPSISKVISADIPRTYPDNTHFQNIICKNGESNLLKNILHAFAANNPEIGYCQGLNYVAALLILVVTTEEKCFWLFDTIITKILPPYYSPGMKSVMVDSLVLEELLRMKASKVYSTIKKMDTSCIAMCIKWFICLFVDVLPIETAVRIMDCIIYEGDKILFRIAFSIIRMNSAQFIATETFPELAVCFTKVVCNESVIDCHNFMKKVFKISNPMPYSKIKRLRKTCETKLMSLSFTS